MGIEQMKSSPEEIVPEKSASEVETNRSESQTVSHEANEHKIALPYEGEALSQFLINLS